MTQFRTAHSNRLARLTKLKRLALLYVCVKIIDIKGVKFTLVDFLLNVYLSSNYCTCTLTD